MALLQHPSPQSIWTARARACTCLGRCMHQTRPVPARGEGKGWERKGTGTGTGTGTGREGVETRTTRGVARGATVHPRRATALTRDSLACSVKGAMMILMLMALPNAALLAMVLRARPAMALPRRLAHGAPKSNASKTSARLPHLADDPQCIAGCIADISAQMRQHCGIAVCEGGLIRIRNWPSRKLPPSLKLRRTGRRTGWRAFVRLRPPSSRRAGRLGRRALVRARPRRAAMLIWILFAPMNAALSAALLRPRPAAPRPSGQANRRPNCSTLTNKDCRQTGAQQSRAAYRGREATCRAQP